MEELSKMIDLDLTRNSTLCCSDPGKEFLEIAFAADRIVSVNSMYVSNRWGAGKHLSPEADKLIAQVREQIYRTGVRNLDLDWLVKDGWYKVTYEFILKDRFESRDVDNCCKVLQDVFTRALNKFDDSRILEIYARKSFLRGKKEYIRIRLEKSEHNPMLYENVRLEEENKEKAAAEAERKRLYKWRDPEGNIHEMTKAGVARFHKDWVLAE